MKILHMKSKISILKKGAWQKMSKKASMEKRENKAIDSDRVVTMKTHEKKKLKMEYFACKRAYGYKTG